MTVLTKRLLEKNLANFTCMVKMGQGLKSSNLMKFAKILAELSMKKLKHHVKEKRQYKRRHRELEVKSRGFLGSRLGS